MRKTWTVVLKVYPDCKEEVNPKIIKEWIEKTFLGADLGIIEVKEIT